MNYDVIIVGAGPAGLAGAIYTGRNRLKTLLISRDLGGQTVLAGEVANYPGIKTINGTELMNLMLQQAQLQKSVEVKIGTESSVIELTRSQDGFIVKTQGGEQFGAQVVLITAGKDPKTLNIPGEKEFKGRGVSYCATCDGPFFKNKTVAIVGGGNAATGAVYMLEKYAAKIYVLTLTDQLVGEAVRLEKIKQSDKIVIVANAHTTKIINDGSKVTGIEYRNGKTGDTAQIKVDGVFVEIGSVPNTKYFGGLVKLNQQGEIEVDKKNATKFPGLYAAGDITSVWGKQIVIAAGEGAKAAMAINEYLSNTK